MYVSRNKQYAVVFAFSMNSDHWSNLAPRLHLQGLIPTAEYEVSEPIPNNISQQSGNNRIIESDIRVYQLGRPTVMLTGDILMNIGLPIKFFSLDDSVMFLLRMKTIATLPSGGYNGNNMSGSNGNRGSNGEYDDNSNRVETIVTRNRRSSL